ncbi:motilin receptor [Canis lupus baileyi]|uniref:Growth hormone secretagogue receptor type 1 n=3 Tax=Canis lupus TaxID=9612 RepID=A0A8C0YVL1_CANLF|nr:motilin receptor [Canis lupus familiaris]XP_025334133.1 motilin receptor [Canis lupus dingo]BAG32139.1 motilin receptor [Canis lupus familiaris]|eukprot:NP_001121536.1 motilin receptor [Canis lupus familiaris]
MGGPGNSSDGAEGAQLPCDERLCSPFPLGALVPVTAVCLGLFAVGVSGNLVTVLLIGRYRDMRTTTNLYLGSMAVSDLLILLGLPLDLYRLWRSRPWVFGQLLCRLSLYLGEGCTYATLLHVTALSVERYLAVCRPLRARALLSRRRARALIAALWAVALLSAAPFFFLVGVEQDAGGPGLNGSARLARAPSPPPGPEAALFSRECRPSPSQLGALRVMLWVTTAYFFLPFLCLCVLYGRIGRELRRRRGPLRGRAASGRERGHRQAVRVLLAVVLAFLVCWLPFHVGRIIYINTEDSRMMHFSQYFNIVALQLFYLSASINPILYNLISKKYRAAARKLLLPRRPTRRRVCRSGAVEGGPGRAAAGLAETGPHGHTAASPSAARQVASRHDPGTSGKTGV